MLSSQYGAGAFLFWISHAPVRTPVPQHRGLLDDVANGARGAGVDFGFMIGYMHNPKS